jgi:hypothetical protein
VSESTSVVSATASSTSTASGTVQAAGPMRVTAGDKGGSPVVGMIAGGGLVLALGISGAVIARRRRATP